MAQRQIQTEVQTQTMTLTPQQLLQVHLMELPLRDFEQRVNEEMLSNEALEEAPGDGADEEAADTVHADEGEETDDVSSARDDALADYVSQDDTPDYLLREQNDSEERDASLPFGQQVSLFETLKDQIGEHELSDKEQEVMVYLIGSLDSDGFLRKDSERLSEEMAVYHNIDVSAEEVDRLIKVLQSFEPRGIGARSLQECLLIQLRSEDYDSPLRDLEIEVIENNYDDFTHKRWPAIERRLHIDEETAARIQQELRRLNPRPGSALGESLSSAAREITPDFIVENDGNGNLTVSLNEGEVPHLRISRSFRGTIADYAGHRDKLTKAQKDTYIYARQKVEAARTFIDAIERRRNNLLAVMRAIVAYQKPFFLEGDEELLRPMILKDIATRTGLDVSTVSRVSNSKYVETEYGVFPLKYFFNDKIVTADGDVHSTVAIRKALQDIIDGEDKKKPYSDERLAALLKEKGYPVARRTVAKYREMLGVPVARLRK